MKVGDSEFRSCVRLISLALHQDLEPGGDRTSQAIIPADMGGKALLVARNSGILAGLPVVEIVLEMAEILLSRHRNPQAANGSPPHEPEGKIGLHLDPGTTRVQPFLEDGNSLHPGDPIARIDGPMRIVLAAERTLLNFIQHLSGIATLTRQFVEATKGLHSRVFDTRKTLPGWRLLEKYAVRCGGGYNHRMGLYDGVLIKDNHLAALGGGPEAIRQSIRAAREKNGPDIPVEIEIESIELLDVALACHPDIILLDNMALGQMKEAVSLRNRKAPKIELEASGGITLDNVRAVAETGVDRISVGALTHSAPALDIALDYEG
jgi:nicotinate-nucleotide pyrophosphorylase (carboxylating)